MATETAGQYSTITLPPIICNERNRVFLYELNVFIENELAAIDITNPDQRYIVHRAAFDKVIEYVHAYKPLLTSIKAEYEECIETIVRGKQEAFYLNGKLKALASQPSTMRNYKKRIDELADRLHIVRGNNQMLEDEIRRLRSTRTLVVPETDTESEFSALGKSPRQPDNRRIPGLSMEESIDPERLEKELVELQKHLRELQVSRHIRYRPQSESEKLKVKLEEKGRRKEQHEREENVLNGRLAKMKVAVGAAKLYNELAGPYTQESIGDVVIEALRRYKRGDSLDEALRIVQAISSSKMSDMFEADEPTKDRNEDAVMEYIHKFNQLFEEGSYQAAAVHAANSPQGVLRTLRTLKKFKDAVPLKLDDPQPLLQFANAVMASVKAVDVMPDDVMTDEFVQCALENGKLELLQHWVSHHLFHPREDLGDMLSNHCACPHHCSCGCQAMAQCMYVETKCSVKAVQSMLEQGLVQQAFRYGTSQCCLNEETCRQLLHENGSPELARLMLFPLGGAKIPVGVACMVLIEKGMEKEACDLLEEVLKGKGGVDVISEELLADDLSEADWQTIATECRHNGQHDVSIHLMSAMMVRSAIQTAAMLLKGSGI